MRASRCVFALANDLATIGIYCLINPTTSRQSAAVLVCIAIIGFVILKILEDRARPNSGQASTAGYKIIY